MTEVADCVNCEYANLNEWNMPCIKCKGTAVHGTEEYDIRRNFYVRKDKPMKDNQEYYDTKCEAVRNMKVNDPPMLENLHNITTTQMKTIAELADLMNTLFGEADAPGLTHDFNCFADELLGARNKADMILSAVLHIKEKFGMGCAE